MTGVMRCKKCKCKLVQGKAIQNTMVGIPDFPGTDYVCTVSPGGPGKLIECLKCPKCGHSIKVNK